MTNFLLGTHIPHWLWNEECRNVPLFVSRRTLSRVKTTQQTVTRWSLDSGGFSELSMYGEWRTNPIQYVAEVRRWRDEIGGLEWAAVQDWMCEPFITAKTRRSVPDHQLSTIVSVWTLRELAPDIHWLPVLQGYHVDDYLRHIDRYAAGCIDLRAEPLVGLGSVCRRQNTAEVAEIVRRVTDEGIRLHGFGFKLKGLERCADMLTSADSLAWSYDARRSPPMAGHEARHRACNNCREFALRWRDRVLTRSLFIH